MIWLEIMEDERSFVLRRLPPHPRSRWGAACAGLMYVRVELERQRRVRYNRRDWSAEVRQEHPYVVCLLFHELEELRERMGAVPELEGLRARITELLEGREVSGE